MHRKKTLYILLDSGSTHNFIDTKIAELLGCKIEQAERNQVAVADGSKIGVCGRVSKLSWKFLNYEFKADFMVIPLGCHDSVLGVQWLSTLGPITWDFKELEMSFRWHNKRVMLHWIKSGSVREVKANRLEKGKEEDMQLHMIYACEDKDMELWNLKTEEKEVVSQEDEAKLQKLTEEFGMIFEEPTQLPPFCEHHNHKIALMEGANPVNQRPYRYAVYQKNEINKMVQKLLKAGTVQSSSSQYASPVALVKKKDNTRRLCVDYRKLNGMTIKDRFPIPLIEDLMDELGGSCVYSKIDPLQGDEVKIAQEDSVLVQNDIFDITHNLR